jgi:hypothetical protein
MPNEPTPPTAVHGLGVASELAALADLLPRHVRLGAVDYRNPAWVGLVWRARRTREELERAGLVEYFAHPWLRTVALDPGEEPSEADLLRPATFAVPCWRLRR